MARRLKSPTHLREDPLCYSTRAGPLNHTVKNLEYSRYRLALKDQRIAAIYLDGDGVPKFVPPVTNKNLPKLYVVKSEGKVSYIGSTTQSIRTRLRGGLQAKGKDGRTGYNYKWKKLHEVELFVWCFPDLKGTEVEFLEAELLTYA